MDEIKLVFPNGGPSFIVVYYSFGSSQAGAAGKASGRPVINPIVIRVEYQGNTHLASWAFSPQKKYTVTLDFISGGQLVSQFEMKDAIAVKYQQQGQFVMDDDAALVAKIVEEVTVVTPEINWDDKAKLTRQAA